MKELARAVREAMERKGHSARQAAQAMGVAPGTVGSWKKGWITDAPDPGNWPKIAEYIDEPEFVILGWLGKLSKDQVLALKSIPGSLRFGEDLRLFPMGYLNPEPSKVLELAG